MLIVSNLETGIRGSVPDLAKIRHFGNIVLAFGKFSMGLFNVWRIYLFWQSLHTNLLCFKWPNIKNII